MIVTSYQSEKTEENFLADSWTWNFLGNREPQCLHLIDSCFISGAQNST